MKGVTAYRADTGAPRNYVDPDRMSRFRRLHLRGSLGWHCSNVLTSLSHPRIRAMPDTEFWPWARARLAEYRSARKIANGG